MTFSMRIFNREHTRSTSLTQAQLNIVVEVINGRTTKKTINAQVLKALEAAGIPPDFNDANSRDEVPPKSKKGNI